MHPDSARRHLPQADVDLVSTFMPFEIVSQLEASVAFLDPGFRKVVILECRVVNLGLTGG